MILPQELLCNFGFVEQWNTILNLLSCACVNVRKFSDCTTEMIVLYFCRAVE